MMQRHTFVKGYITAQKSNTDKYLRIEESYDGQNIEIFVGNDGYNCACDCDSDCHDLFGINLSREQVKEMIFCLKQLHFIDKDSK